MQTKTHTKKVQDMRSDVMLINLRAVLVEILALLVGRSRVLFPVMSLGILSVTPPDRTMCPDVDSASENEYQGCLLG